MNRFILLLAAILMFFVQNPAIAGQPASRPEKTAEDFYAGYLTLVNKEKDTRSWVSKSDLVTNSFRKWYAKTMADASVESDPVLEAQDTPITSYKTAKTSIEGGKATVTLKAKYSRVETQTLRVNMLLVNGVWKIDSISAAK